MPPSPFATVNLDSLVHGRTRLGIIAYLAHKQSATFSEVREIIEATDGNLSTHLKKLENKGYISVDKAFVDGKPQTRISLTVQGRESWHKWVEEILTIMKISV